MPGLLAARDVSYTYPLTQTPALNHLSLELQQGQRTAILGRNGCGKSTLFCLANGLLKPDRGEILWQGVPLDYRRSQLFRWRQKVGLVFQNPEQQLVAGTVAEDISYGLCNLQLGQWEIKTRLEQGLEAFELTDLRHTPLHHLSLGQKRRVALAGVMVLNPELLLLDEPTTFLDSYQTQALLLKLDQIHQSQTTIVMATHDVNLAYGWADQLVVLDQGQVVMTGTPGQVCQHLEQYPELGLELPLIWQLWRQLNPDQADLANIPRTLPQLQAWLIHPMITPPSDQHRS